jgi:uncharacterized protein YsxB (DUF464 family)
VIRVKVEIDSSGCLAQCTSSGHSIHSFQGNNTVCIAVSTLVRTMSRILFIESDIEVEGNAQSEGAFYFTVMRIPDSKREWLKGISDFFIRGIEDLLSEYPDDVYMDIKRKK